MKNFKYFKYRQAQIHAKKVILCYCVKKYQPNIHISVQRKLLWYKVTFQAVNELGARVKLWFPITKGMKHNFDSKNIWCAVKKKTEYGDL